MVRYNTGEMNTGMLKPTVIVATLALGLAGGAWAQGSGVNPPVVAPGQNPPVASSIPPPLAQPPSLYGGPWEVFVGGSMQFAKATTANQTAINSANVAGGQAALRLHFADSSAIEMRYAIAWPTQTYGLTGTVHARAWEISFDYVYTLPTESRFKPFLEGGGGVITYTPIGANNPSYAVSQRKLAANYGGGLEIALRGHLGLRAEYRGLIYRIPDFGGIRITNWNHMPEPDIGLVWHF